MSTTLSAHARKALCLVLAAAMACLCCISTISSAFADGGTSGMKATYVEEYDPTLDMPTYPSANSWQVVSQEYSAVKAGDGSYSYSDQNDVRVQKAVMGDGTENEFQVYLNVEPQLSWEEFFRSLDNYSTHNNSETFNPNSGCSRLLSQDEYDALPSTKKSEYVPINITYNLGNGKTVDVTRYGNFYGANKERIQAVPNGSYCWSSEKFSTNGLIHNINWASLVSAAQAGQTDLRLVVDASSIRQQFTFADNPVYPREVTDPMGDNIIYQGLVSADQGSVTEPAAGTTGGSIVWTLPTATPPDFPYYSTHTETGLIPGTNVPGSYTIVDNIAVTTINGKITAYYTNILEMRYRVSLDVLGESFVSSAPATEPAQADAIFPTNGETVLDYETEQGSYETEFPIPEVRGLLYDLEAMKVDAADPSKHLEGATFQLVDGDGNAVLDESGNPITTTSGSDGVAKFHNLPFGTYAMVEIAPPTGYKLSGDPNTQAFELCYTTNRALVQDHSGLHQADLPSDVLNMTIPGNIPTIENSRALGLEILKQDGDDETPLEGVEFTIYEDDGDGQFTSADQAAQIYTDVSLTVLSNVDATDADGKAQFYDFAPGTYWIVETQTLPGYQLLDDPVKMTVSDDFHVYFHESMVEVLPDSNFVVHITVDNFKIKGLPVTGSKLGLLLLLAGIALIASSLVALGRRRPKSKH